jgi:hypothetical protein
MALPVYCPSCRSIRQPNGSFCHICGYSYLTKEAATAAVQPPGAISPGPRLSVGDGFRFGVGFMAAVFIGSLIGFVLWIILFVSMLGALFGGIGR